MSSTVRNGFSTLNRLLGKKNKDSNLSKSTTNLSKSTTNLDTSSQHNQIMPLAASNNAPFEQTFRVTICLPRDQLYVVRVGAKTKLANLLEMICINKQLDKSKFEFRHPANGSQVFSNDLTIGEVGLNEIRLANKNDRHDTIYQSHNILQQQTLPRHFTNDKFYQQSNNLNNYNSRESLTSSEYSKTSSSAIISSTHTNRYSLKTTTSSPYSSTNSLNSIDSTGLNGGRSSQPTAPTRKKRIAPRPPSQNSIPENNNNIVVNGLNGNRVNGDATDDDSNFKRPLPVMPRKNFHVSTPNLTNINDTKAQQEQQQKLLGILSKESTEQSKQPSPAEDEQKRGSINSLNRTTNHARPNSLTFTTHINGNSTPINGGGAKDNRSTSYVDVGDNIKSYNSHSRTSSESSEIRDGSAGPEPTPRKRIFVAKKKAPPPAPPPRSNNNNNHNAGLPPVAPPRSISTTTITAQPEIIHIEKSPVDERINGNSPKTPPTSPNNNNISKIMLNVDHSAPLVSQQITTRPVEEQSPTLNHPKSDLIKEDIKIQTIKDTDDNSSLSSMSSMSPSTPITDVGLITNGDRSDDKDQSSPEHYRNVDNVSKTSTQSPVDSCFSSDEDDEKTKIYNIKIGQTRVIDAAKPKLENVEIVENIKNENKEVIKQLQQQQSIIIINSQASDVDVKVVEDMPKSPILNKNLDLIKDQEASSPPTASRSESPLWQYTLPAPAKFADQNVARTELYNGSSGSATINSDVSSDFSDIPIKPVINERLPLDFLEVFNETSTVTSNTITSDIEDGYHGNGMDGKQKFSREALLEGLERRREQFIESEFDFLTQLDDDESLKSLERNGSDLIVTAKEEIKQKDFTVNHRESVTKNDVIQELHEVLDGKIESVIRKPEENVEIECAKRSSLKNFTIQSYGSAINATKSTNQEDDSTTRRNFILSSAEEDVTDDSTSYRKYKEFTPVKRTSLTLTNGIVSHFKSPKINRSGSFHSTTTPFAETIGLTPRSASYISLIGSQKFEKPKPMLRKSSSELSIADSPSLQSLVVLKSILSNSRKNSLNNDMSNNVDPIVTLRNASELILEQSESMNSSLDLSKEVNVSIEEPKEILSNDSSKENSPKNKIDVEDAKKTWKYQGPPAINLSTWGERPRSIISIKNDSDYKFGGGQTTTTTYNRALSTNVARQIDNQLPKTSFQQKILNAEENIYNKKGELHSDRPVVCGVVKKNPVNNSEVDGNEIPQLRRPSYEISTFIAEKPINNTTATATTTTTTTTISLGRVPIPMGNRFSTGMNLKHSATQTFTNRNSTPFMIGSMNSTNKFGPVVKGFKNTFDSQDDKSSSEGYKSLPAAAVADDRPKTPAIAAKPSVKYPIKSNAAEPVAPFSQFTLRKTGLKDKILADNENTQHVVSPKIVSIEPQIQLRQQQSTNFSAPQQQLRPVTANKPTIATTAFLLRSQSTPVSTLTSTPAPPPPPPKLLTPPIIKTSKLPPLEIEPRDQLLDAIRNFNKNKLNKN